MPSRAGATPSVFEGLSPEPPPADPPEGAALCPPPEGVALPPVGMGMPPEGDPMLAGAVGAPVWGSCCGIWGGLMTGGWVAWVGDVSLSGCPVGPRGSRAPGAGGGGAWVSGHDACASEFRLERDPW